jgi:hypothetical protein
MATGATTTVTGTTTPGAAVDVAAGQPGSPTNASAVIATTAGSDGHFSADVPTPAGTTVITAAASRGASATGWSQVTVSGG